MVSTVKMTICITLPSMAVISQTISGIWRSCDFSKWWQPPSCVFKFSKFLMIGRVKRVKLHQCTKFHVDRSNHGRYMAIFRFSNMAAAAILDLKNLKFLVVAKISRVILHHRAKFCRNRSNCGRNRATFQFSNMAAAAIMDF